MSDHDDIVRLSDQFEMLSKSLGDRLGDVYVRMDAIALDSRSALKDMEQRLKEHVGLTVNGRVATLTERTTWLKAIVFGLVGTLLTLAIQFMLAAGPGHPWGKPVSTPVPYKFDQPGGKP